MIPQYNFKLKFSVSEIINESWVKPHPTLFFVKHYDIYDEWAIILNSKFLELINSINPIGRMMVFNKPRSWAHQDAHIDPGILYALNVVTADSNAKMQWFDLINKDNKKVSYTITNAPYVNYTTKELNLVHEECIDNTASIVRADIPHRIAIGNADRTCISFRFKKKFSCWEDMYYFYKNLDWIAD
jgi:hypothetical protein